MAGDSTSGHTFVQMDTRQHEPANLTTGPRPGFNRPARTRQTAASGRKSGNGGRWASRLNERRSRAVSGDLATIVADGRDRVSAAKRPATPTIQPGNIIIKLASEIAVLRYIPVRTPCIVSSVTHGDEPYYWLRDARTNAYIGGMCTELMMGFRKVHHGR